MDSKELLRLIDLLEKESAARAADHIAFRLTISELNTTIGKLHETIGNLLEENRLLKTPKKNSRNSSVPPSKDENRLKKTNSLRQSSGKRPGGQSGHEGSTLKMTGTPDTVIEHRPLYCTCCGLGLHGQESELISRRQVIDIPPIKPVYTEHQLYRAVCSCGHQATGTFPQGVDAPISYGIHTEALIAYLHTRQYVPFARASEFFGSVCNMPISQGSVCAILERFCAKAGPAYQLIKEAIKESKVIGADETGMNENGRLGWFWAWQSKVATFISYSATRGSAAISANFPDGFPDAVLVHDCWKSHLNTPALGHQLCVAHLLRELLFFEQKYQSAWSSNFKKMLYRALELKKTISSEAYNSPLKERAELEAKLLQLLEEIIPDKEVEVNTFQRRIIRYRQHLFTFLYHPEVPPDNNASERAVRNVKVKQKVSGLFKSAKGAQIYAVIRSITDTCIKNGQGIIQAFQTIANLQPE
jgi:transposase